MKGLTWLFLLLAIPIALWALDQIFYLIPGPVLSFVWIAVAITWLVVAVIAVAAWLINRAVKGGFEVEADTLGGGAVQLSTLEKMKARGYFTPEKQKLIREAVRELQARRSNRPGPAEEDGAG